MYQLCRIFLEIWKVGLKQKYNKKKYLQQTEAKSTVPECVAV